MAVCCSQYRGYEVHEGSREHAREVPANFSVAYVTINPARVVARTGVSLYMYCNTLAHVYAGGRALKT